MHLAAQSHVDNSFGNSIQFSENNILVGATKKNIFIHMLAIRNLTAASLQGTHVLLECAKAHNLKVRALANAGLCRSILSIFCLLYIFSSPFLSCIDLLRFVKSNQIYKNVSVVLGNSNLREITRFVHISTDEVTSSFEIYTFIFVAFDSHCFRCCAFGLRCTARSPLRKARRASPKRCWRRRIRMRPRKPRPSTWFWRTTSPFSCRSSSRAATTSMVRINSRKN